MRKIWSGENLMHLSREVCGRLLVRVGLVKGKLGDIAVGVINAARWRSIGQRRIWRRWQWGLFFWRLHRQKETSAMRCLIFRAHDGRRSQWREIVGIRKVDLRCVFSSMRFDFTYVEDYISEEKKVLVFESLNRFFWELLFVHLRKYRRVWGNTVVDNPIRSDRKEGSQICCS